MSEQGSTDVPMQPDIATSCTACCAAAAQEAAPTHSGEPTRGLDSRLVAMEFNSRFCGEPAYYANAKIEEALCVNATGYHHKLHRCCAAAAQEAAPTCSGEPKRGLDSRLVAMGFNLRLGGEPAYYAKVKLWKH
jgi:hypothetical protein